MLTWPRRGRLSGRLVNVHLLLAFLLTPAASAYDFSALKPQGYVSDFARVVDPQSKAALERYCAEIEKTTGLQIALVTLPTLHGEPIEDVANLLFRRWGVGQKKTNQGALFLLAIREHRSRLELGYGLEPAISDGAAGALLRSMRPALRENHFGDAFVLAVRELGTRIELARGVRIEGGPPAPARARSGGLPEWIPVAIVFAAGGLLVLFLAGAAGGPRHRRGGVSTVPWWLLAAGAQRNWRGSSHGGFGGYDSGDRFGGFGGGDSGGGGASSSW